MAHEDRWIHYGLVQNSHERSLGRTRMESRTGQFFGKHRTIRLIGEGDLGAIYLVENSLIDRRGAVRIRHTALAAAGAAVPAVVGTAASDVPQ